MSVERVAGYCPMGCGQTLYVEDSPTSPFGRTIACTADGCPAPLAVEQILAETETEHIVWFDDEGFTVRHPLRERLNDALMTCDLHVYCARLAGPRVPPGRHRATWNGMWIFTPAAAS